KLDGLEETIEKKLDEIQISLFEKARNFRKENTIEVESYEQFKSDLEKKGGLFYGYWDGTEETEEKIKQETKATIRCIAFEKADLQQKFDIYSVKPAKYKVLYAKAY